eukprot:scaffold15134_cov101-Isochrysis_galbana.AAC.1
MRPNRALLAECSCRELACRLARQLFFQLKEADQSRPVLCGRRRVTQQRPVQKCRGGDPISAAIGYHGCGDCGEGVIHATHTVAHRHINARRGLLLRRAPSLEERCTVTGGPGWKLCLEVCTDARVWRRVGCRRSSHRLAPLPRIGDGPRGKLGLQRMRRQATRVRPAAAAREGVNPCVCRLMNRTVQPLCRRQRRTNTESSEAFVGVGGTAQVLHRCHVVGQRAGSSSRTGHPAHARHEGAASQPAAQLASARRFLGSGARQLGSGRRVSREHFRGGGDRPVGRQPLDRKAL